jgi:hypothetical protein
MKTIVTIIGILLCFNTFSQSDNDCTFNNDYKELTTEWLTELGKTDFIWNAKTNQAEIQNGQDTIVVSKGDCIHFNTLVELRLGNNTHTLEDNEYWLKKALYLATEFDLKHYKKMLEENEFNRVEARKNVILFDIKDDEIDDNLFYVGVEINFENNRKIISLSEYYN